MGWLRRVLDNTRLRRNSASSGEEGILPYSHLHCIVFSPKRPKASALRGYSCVGELKVFYEVEERFFPHTFAKGEYNDGVMGLECIMKSQRPCFTEVMELGSAYVIIYIKIT